MTNELLPSTAQVLPSDQRGSKAPRMAAVALLGLVVVLTVMAVVGAWMATRDDSTSDEALFVLPAPGAGWQLSNGAVTEPIEDEDAPATDERFIDQGILYGNADGDGFDDLRSIVHYPESPLPGAQWEPASVPTGGDSYRLLDDSVTFAQQEYAYEGAWEGLGGGWTVASSPDDLVHAYDVLSNDTYDLVRVAFFAPLETSQAPTASFVMTSPEGSAFTVETATGSPLFDAATYAERVEPVDVNSTAGWVVTREGEGATETVVTWSPELGRTISVRSSAPRGAVVDAARLLQPVTADEWASAFPGPPPD
ncbi:MAG TPA: hypothetical protein VLN74_07085 [Ilumatobacteraceae bacterium]|nr:hypothetical protein [Ilumatobacteraceae bacterium]